MKKYILICAAGHSGSTLLDLLLGSHSNIESLGEITQLPKNISLNTECTCGKPVRKCPLWKNVLQTIGKVQGKNFFNTPYALNLGFINAKVVVDRKHQTKGYDLRRKFFRSIAYSDLAYGLDWLKKINNPIDESIHNNLLLYDTVMKIQGINYIVDSSKDYLKGVKLYLSRPKQVKLILLTRDGRGVFYSNIKRGFSKKKSLIGWRNYYLRTLRLTKKYVTTSDIFCVKYEDLATQPDIVLKRISKFIGIEYEDTMIDFINHQHHITDGNNMRFQHNSDIRFDIKWKSALNKSDKQLFSKICRIVNAQLGYNL